MSREAAEQEERLRRGDDLRLQMALEESKKEGPVRNIRVNHSSPNLSLGSAPKPAVPADPWGAPSSLPSVKSGDPWASNPSTPASDPWGSAAARPKTSHTGSFDLFSTSNGTSKEDFSEFDSLRSSSSVPTASSVPSQASLASSSSLDFFDPLPSTLPSSFGTNPTRKTPESFLGPNAALVNLDSLVTKPAQPAPAVNPFLASGAAHVNPFQVGQPVPPTLNQMRVSPMPSGFGSMVDPMPLSSLPAQPVVPPAGMAPMGHGMSGMGAAGGMGTSGEMNAGYPASMTMPQPLMTMPAQAGSQPTGPTNPFLL
uniref:Epsin 2 n=1 Tax=Nothobranchius furzeri TaxID=105023 RepID=A0A8C6P7K6_NOTFU